MQNDFNQRSLENALAGLDLGGVRYFERCDSTNEQAAQWLNEGAPDLALVVAGEQLAGRGRAGRSWHSPAQASLAFSLAIYPTWDESLTLSRMTALGALAVCDALRNRYRLAAEIKWPNDVLLDGRKVSGVLVEAQWSGERVSSVILGIGINIAPPAVPADAQLRYPATCIEASLGRPVERIEILHTVLNEILRWRPRLAGNEFLRAWENSLAFRNDWVEITLGETPDANRPASGQPPLHEGQIVGLAADGALKLRARTGDVVSLEFGEVRLRPRA